MVRFKDCLSIDWNVNTIRNALFLTLFCKNIAAPAE